MALVERLQRRRASGSAAGASHESANATPMHAAAAVNITRQPKRSMTPPNTNALAATPTLRIRARGSARAPASRPPTASSMAAGRAAVRPGRRARRVHAPT
jgi:hypothetical protein